MKIKKEKISIYIPHDIVEKLNEISECFAISRNTIVELALAEFLTNSMMSKILYDFKKIRQLVREEMGER
jgi:metal-responsive CopG/Arc/MetJ family transcriptional regulator